MVTTPQSKPGRPKRPRGWSRHTVLMDDRLYQDAREFAKAQRSSLRAILERALREHLAADTASRQDRILAPLVDEVIQERHRRLESGLRTMMARTALEVLRSQYVWLNFMTEAGIAPGKINAWHDQGWQFAVKELKRQRTQDAGTEQTDG